MGMLVGGIYLIANNPSQIAAACRYVQLFRFALPPILAAIALAPIGALLICRWDPLNFRSPSQLGDLLAPIQATRFLTVWGMHLGIYAGGLLGTVFGVFAIRRHEGASKANFSQTKIDKTLGSPILCEYNLIECTAVHPVVVSREL